MKRSSETNIGSKIIITPQEDNHCAIALIQRPKKKKENPKYFLGIHMQVGISNKNREMSEG